MIPTVKSRDTDRLLYRANMDLTGAQSVRLVAKASGGSSVDLATEVVDAAAGLVEHQRDGTLPPGTYVIELHVVTQDGVLVTFPNGEDDELLTVRRSL